MISPGPRNFCKSQLSNRLRSPEMLQLRERLPFPCDETTWLFITFTGLAQTAASEVAY